MTETTIAAQATRVAAENEAAREIAAPAAPDTPNPDVGDQMSDAAGQRSEGTDPTSDIRPASSEAKPLERITAADRGRADIAARFKEKRAAHGGQVEFHGDMRDPSQTYGPLGLAPEPMSDVGDHSSEAGDQRSEAEATEQREATRDAPSAQPVPPTSDMRPPTSESKLVKVKVHGREMFLPENEVIAEAQKSLAAGNLLESAKEVLAGVRPRRTDVGDRMPEETDPTSDIRHPTSDIRSLRRAGAHAATGERGRRRRQAQTNDRERDREGAPGSCARSSASRAHRDRTGSLAARPASLRTDASRSGIGRVRARRHHHPGAARDQRRPAGCRRRRHTEGAAEDAGRAQRAAHAAAGVRRAGSLHRRYFRYGGNKIRELARGHILLRAARHGGQANPRSPISTGHRAPRRTWCGGDPDRRTASRAFARARATAGQHPQSTDPRHRAAASRATARANHGRATERRDHGHAESTWSNSRVRPRPQEIRNRKSELGDRSAHPRSFRLLISDFRLLIGLPRHTPSTRKD
jgi:hypothetical protein